MVTCVGKQAIEGRENKMNEDTQVARLQIHEGHSLQDIISRKNGEYDKLASEMKRIQQELVHERNGCRDYYAYVESEIENTKRNLRSIKTR